MSIIKNIIDSKSARLKKDNTDEDQDFLARMIIHKDDWTEDGWDQAKAESIASDEWDRLEEERITKQLEEDIDNAFDYRDEQSKHRRHHKGKHNSHHEYEADDIEEHDIYGHSNEKRKKSGKAQFRRIIASFLRKTILRPNIAKVLLNSLSKARNLQAKSNDKNASIAKMQNQSNKDNKHNQPTNKALHNESHAQEGEPDVDEVDIKTKDNKSNSVLAKLFLQQSINNSSTPSLTSNKNNTMQHAVDSNNPHHFTNLPIGNPFSLGNVLSNILSSSYNVVQSIAPAVSKLVNETSITQQNNIANNAAVITTTITTIASQASHHHTEDSNTKNHVHGPGCSHDHSHHNHSNHNHSSSVSKYNSANDNNHVVKHAAGCACCGHANIGSISANSPVNANNAQERAQVVVGTSIGA